MWLFQNSGTTPVRHIAKLNTGTNISSENRAPVSFSVYPNPAESVVHIQHNGNVDEKSFTFYRMNLVNVSEK